MVSSFMRLGAAAMLMSAALSSPGLAIDGGAGDAAGDARAVMILNDAGGFCTAVVIAPRALLTAGHCLAGGRQLRAHWREAGEPIMRAPASIAVHSGFVGDAVRRRARSIDLGLVRLSEPLPARFAAAILSSRSHVAAGAAVAASGYGPTTRRDPRSSGTFRRVALAAIEPYGPSAILLWASSPRGGVCPGDSGGPMEDSSGAVAAIIAWGGTAGASGCAGAAQGVLVAPQRNWIDATLRGWGMAATWSGE